MFRAEIKDIFQACDCVAEEFLCGNYAIGHLGDRFAENPAKQSQERA